MYWPSRQTKTEVHGPLRITHLDEEAFAFYTVRRFEVEPVDLSSHYCQVCTHRPFFCICNFINSTTGKYRYVYFIRYGKT